MSGHTPKIPVATNLLFIPTSGFNYIDNSRCSFDPNGHQVQNRGINLQIYGDNKSMVYLSYKPSCTILLPTIYKLLAQFQSMPEWSVSGNINTESFLLWQQPPHLGPFMCIHSISKTNDILTNFILPYAILQKIHIRV